MIRRQELEKEGWIRRFMAGEPRLSEAVEEYQELGFEVLMEPIDPREMNGECASCFRDLCDQYKIIYTRQKKLPGWDKSEKKPTRETLRNKKLSGKS